VQRVIGDAGEAERRMIRSLAMGTAAVAAGGIAGLVIALALL